MTFSVKTIGLSAMTDLVIPRDRDPAQGPAWQAYPRHPHLKAISLHDGDGLALASCYFYDGAGVIFQPLAFATGYWFNTAIRLRRKSP